MKKTFCALVSLVFIMMTALCLSACTNDGTLYFLPSVSWEGGNATTKLVTNIEGDVTLPNGVVMKHEYFERGLAVEWAWLLTDGDKTVGWIEMDGSCMIYSDRSEYGIAAVKNGDKYRFENVDIRVYLLGQQAQIFDSITLQVNYGKIAFLDTYTISRTEDLGIVGRYELNLSDVDPKAVEKLSVTIRCVTIL